MTTTHPTPADDLPDFTPTASPTEVERVTRAAAMLNRAADTAATTPHLPPHLRAPISDVLRVGALDADACGVDYRTVVLGEAILGDLGAPTDNVDLGESTPEQLRDMVRSLRVRLDAAEADRAAADTEARVVDAPGRAPGVVERLETENDTLRGNVGRLEWALNRVRDVVAAMDSGVDAMALRAALDPPPPESLPGIHAGANPMRVAGPGSRVPDLPPPPVLRFDADRLSRGDGAPVEVLAEHARHVGSAAQSLNAPVSTNSNSKEI